MEDLGRVRSAGSLSNVQPDVHRGVIGSDLSIFSEPVAIAAGVIASVIAVLVVAVSVWRYLWRHFTSEGDARILSPPSNAENWGRYVTVSGRVPRRRWGSPDAVHIY